MIEVRNLTKCYDSFRAVDGISFTVREGEIVGFLGPNGAGKTTTIRILTCYHPATSGSASVAGERPTRVPTSAWSRRSSAKPSDGTWSSRAGPSPS